MFGTIPNRRSSLEWSRERCGWWWNWWRRGQTREWWGCSLPCLISGPIFWKAFNDSQCHRRSENTQQVSGNHSRQPDDDDDDGTQFFHRIHVICTANNDTLQFMQGILVALQTHPITWSFMWSVVRDEVPDYYDVIKRPMGLSCSLSDPF